MSYWPFGGGIHMWQVDSPHKGPVLCKAFPNDDDIIYYGNMDWFNIGSGNGLLPGGTKPLPKPM